MIFRTPFYYDKFRCIADKCKDNCCIGWEIDIDDTTAQKYRKVTGNFGKRLIENIDFSEHPCFILGENERCPFLNDRNLCDIITELGENCLCQICDDHPRYYEWFGNVKEGGIGMCCEAAAEIILNSPLPFTCTEFHIDEENSPPCDEYLYNLIFNLRERIINILNDENIHLSSALSHIIEIAAVYQDCADNNRPEPDTIPEITAGTADIESILRFMTTLEYISERRIPILLQAIERIDELRLKKETFVSENQFTDQYLRNTAIYYIWRHLMKGIFEGEFYSRVIFSVTSTIIAMLLWEMKWIDSGLSAADCIEIAKDYSKEIEYNEDNTDAMLNAAYEICGMQADSLIDILKGR